MLWLPLFYPYSSPLSRSATRRTNLEDAIDIHTFIDTYIIRVNSLLFYCCKNIKSFENKVFCFIFCFDLAVVQYFRMENLGVPIGPR